MEKLEVLRILQLHSNDCLSKEFLHEIEKYYKAIKITHDLFNNGIAFYYLPEHEFEIKVSE